MWVIDEFASVSGIGIQKRNTLHILREVDITIYGGLLVCLFACFDLHMKEHSATEGSQLSIGSIQA